MTAHPGAAVSLPRPDVRCAALDFSLQRKRDPACQKPQNCGEEHEGAEPASDKVMHRRKAPPSLRGEGIARGNAKISSEAGLSSSGSPAAQFLSAAAPFHPNIEKTPDGFTHLGFVGLQRKLAASEPRRALPPRAPLRLNFSAQQHHFPPQYRTNPRRQAAWGSFNREENMRREKLAN